MPSQLDFLRAHSVVVADTADFALLARYQPQDATTNPSLILQGATHPSHRRILLAAAAHGLAVARAQLAALPPHTASPNELRDPRLFRVALEAAMDEVAVLFGLEILKLIPGRVSTEVDARLSFDMSASVAKARAIVGRYAEHGIGRDRLYIKLAATWQGVRAAEQLERDGIRCNLTLLFSFAQAVACAQAKVALVSPFVGRILDWHVARYAAQNPAEAAAGKKKTYSADQDPGVVSVRRIFFYYKAHGYATTVMAASFRNTGEVLALAGCDKVTVSPALLQQMQTTELAEAQPKKALDATRAAAVAEPKLPMLTEAAFLQMHHEDPMAVEKLAEGIRSFAADTVKLEVLLAAEITKQLAQAPSKL